MKIFVTDQTGATHELEAVAGWRVMEIIREHGLPIKAECGGACACATCHVYVAEEWLGKLSEKDDMEDSMLDAAYERKDNSRLTCQLEMNDAWDGLVVHVGENEY